MTKLNLL